MTITATPGPSDEPTTAQLETTLSQQQTQLQKMLTTAPEPARSELRQALEATRRSRALVADPKSADSAGDDQPAPPTVASTAKPSPGPGTAEVFRGSSAADTAPGDGEHEAANVVVASSATPQPIVPAPQRQVDVAAAGHAESTPSVAHVASDDADRREVAVQRAVQANAGAGAHVVDDSPLHDTPVANV